MLVDDSCCVNSLSPVCVCVCFWSLLFFTLVFWSNPRAGGHKTLQYLVWGTRDAQKREYVYNTYARNTKSRHGAGTRGQYVFPLVIIGRKHKQEHRGVCVLQRLKAFQQPPCRSSCRDHLVSLPLKLGNESTPPPRRAGSKTPARSFDIRRSACVRKCPITREFRHRCNKQPGQVDGSAASTAAGEGDGGGELVSAFRRTRVLSCPTTVRGTPSPSRGRRGRGSSAGGGGGRGPGLSGVFVVAGSADNVSSARGITMGDVHGSVRSKTAPVEEEPAAAAAAAVNLYADTAVAEIISLRLSGGDPEAAAGGGPGGARDEEERMFRATSSAATVFCAPAPEASSKRAKSGATTLEVSSGGVGAWMADKPPGAPQRQPTPAESLSAMSIDKAAGKVAPAAVAPPAAGGGGGDSDAPVVEGAAAAAGAAAAIAPAPALSNDEWLARLSPLLESIPAGTHPEDFLHSILKERGYTAEMAAMKETVFHRAPEPDQVAAYDKAILRAVLDEDEAALERMRVAGRRMDACNRFGDSVLHMACRRGRAAALRFLVRATGPAGVVLSDDFGRTVLHDACWTASPRFDVASAVLDVDTRLLRTLDSRGSSPLQYVPQDQWPLWCAFFESRKEVYWPQLAPGVEDVAGIIPLTVV